MGFDEAWLEGASQPLLRVYSWAEPAISLGYFESFAAADRVREASGAREIVRRPTGGGIVTHGGEVDFTYTLIVPRADLALLGASAADHYRVIHQAVAAELRAHGQEASVLETRENRRVPGALEGAECFQRPVRSDVMAGDRKLAGAGQRRTRRGLLHQGSIQEPGLPADFGLGLARRLAATVEIIDAAPEEVMRQARELAETKYATDAWRRRRP